jgi:hypothetical protein
LPSGNWVIIQEVFQVLLIPNNHRISCWQYSFTVTNESGVSAPTAIVLISDSSTKWTFNDGVGN